MAAALSEMSGAVRVGQLAVAAVALSPKRDPDDPLAKALDYLAVPTGSQRVMLLLVQVKGRTLGRHVSHQGSRRSILRHACHRHSSIPRIWPLG